MFIHHWSPIAIVEVAMEMGPRIVCYREGTEKSRYAFFDGWKMGYASFGLILSYKAHSCQTHSLHNGVKKKKLKT